MRAAPPAYARWSRSRLYHDFENFTRFSPTDVAVDKADEMLAQLASWGRALRTVREGRAVAA